VLRLLLILGLAGAMLSVESSVSHANEPPPPRVVVSTMQFTENAQPSATPTPAASPSTSPTSANLVAPPTPTPFTPVNLKDSQIRFEVQVLNCVPWDWCQAKAQLHFKSKEYLPGYQVSQVYLRIGDRERRYDGEDALLSLPATNEDGAWIEYWAVSNHQNDLSPIFKLKYRYVASATDPTLFRFDLLGEDWAEQAPSGSLLWGLFPPVDGSIPKALDQPLSAKYLYSTNRYIFLAGNLIQAGLVKAGGCPNNGLSANGSATVCGEKAGAEQVLAWQNKYDEQIYAAALKYNIPARVLKGILAQESQFWPTSSSPYELGLGKFTENGADMLLMWNVDYFLQTCLPVYGSVSCSAGYASLNPPARMILRRALIDKVGSQDEIDLLAATLYASAAQTGQMVQNTSGQEPAVLTNYEHMWMITIGNYYAGSGCTGQALQALNDAGKPFTWEGLIAQMQGDCKNATIYVQKVFGASQ
jgi:hypothetical protein